jgi:hypothetical protein
MATRFYALYITSAQLQAENSPTETSFSRTSTAPCLFAKALSQFKYFRFFAIQIILTNSHKSYITKMNVLIERTEALEKEMIDPDTDRRYIIDCAIRTGAQGAPFEDELVEDALKHLWEVEKEGNVHRWYDRENAAIVMEKIMKDANEVSSEELVDAEEIAAQLKEETGKSVEQNLTDLKKMLGFAHELADNIEKIRHWLDDGTDALMEHSESDPIKRAEVIVGLSTLSGFLSDYFSIMEVIRQQEDEDEEEDEEEADEREVVEKKPKKLRQPGASKPQQNSEVDFNAAPQTDFFGSNEGKQGFGFSSVEYDIPEGDEDQEGDEEEEGDFYDDEFDDSDEISQCCFTMAQVANDDQIFMKTLQLAMSVTSLVMKDFEEWVGVEFGLAEEDEEEREEEDDECPDLVDAQ